MFTVLRSAFLLFAENLTLSLAVLLPELTVPSSVREWMFFNEEGRIFNLCFTSDNPFKQRWNFLLMALSCGPVLHRPSFGERRKAADIKRGWYRQRKAARFDLFEESDCKYFGSGFFFYLSNNLLQLCASSIFI